MVSVAQSVLQLANDSRFPDLDRQNDRTLTSSARSNRKLSDDGISAAWESARQVKELIEPIDVIGLPLPHGVDDGLLFLDLLQLGGGLIERVA